MHKKFTKQNVIKNTILFIVSSIIAISLIIAGGEAYFRIFLGINEKMLDKRWTTDHSTRGWALKPGNYTYFSLNAFRKTEIQINSFGVREQGFTLEIPQDKERITIIGDSFVFSDVLRESERFSGLLKRLADEKYDIVNISVPSYGTGQEILLLKELISQGFEVGSKVVLFFFTNDVVDNLGLDYYRLERDPQVPAFHVDEYGELRYTFPPKRAPSNHADISPNILDTLVFYYFVYNRAELLISKYPWLYDFINLLGFNVNLPRIPGIVSSWYTSGWRERWEKTEEILNYFKNFVEDNLNAKFFIAFIPSPFQVEDIFQRIIATKVGDDLRYEKFLSDINRPQRILKNYCLKNNISFIDITGALKTDQANDRCYFLREGHLNEYGSSIVAGVLYDYIFLNEKDSASNEENNDSNLPGRNEYSLRWN